MKGLRQDLIYMSAIHLARLDTLKAKKISNYRGKARDSRTELNLRYV